MDHFQEYLAAEVAIDHVAGQLTRREALRRLGTLGLSAVAASALIAACGNDKNSASTAPSGQSTTVAPGASPSTGPPTTPVAAQDITYPSPNGTLMGAYAAAASPRGAVIVVHQNMGLVANIRDIASRMAGDGFSALAVDLLSEEGGTAKVATGDVAGALNNAGPTRIRVDLHAAADELAKRNPGAKLGLIGFCFGGTVVWDFLSEGEPRLAAAAPFYGTVAEGVSFAKNKAAVLGVYGETDARVNATRDAAKAALDATTVPHQLKTYPGVGHGFYTDVGSEQSKAAYADVLDWFGRYLK